MKVAGEEGLEGQQWEEALTFADLEADVGPVNGVDRRGREGSHCEYRAWSNRGSWVRGTLILLMFGTRGGADGGVTLKSIGFDSSMWFDADEK